MSPLARQRILLTCWIVLQPSCCRAMQGRRGIREQSDEGCLPAVARIPGVASQHRSEQRSRV